MKLAVTIVVAVLALSALVAISALVLWIGSILAFVGFDGPKISYEICLFLTLFETLFFALVHGISRTLKSP